MTTEPMAPAVAAPPADRPGVAPPPPVRPGTGPAPPDERRGIRLAPRSLSARLLVGVVVLVFSVVLATGLGTYLALRSFLYDRLDQQVAALADSNLNLLRPCIALGVDSCQLRDNSVGLSAPQVEWLVVIGPDGSVVGEPVRTRAIVGMSLTEPQRAAIVDAPQRVRTLTTTDGATIRVSGRAVQSQSGTYVVATGLSTDEATKTLRRLLELELVIGSVAVLAAFLATNYGVRFSLRRLHSVTRTAREVAAELSPSGTGLDRRVEVTEPDTEVGQLAESMNTLLAAVETQFAARVASEERMRQFLADASHELRTPLTSIRGYAELARMQRASGHQTDDAGNLERIEFEGTRMSRLVEDLLTLARSDQSTADGMPVFDDVDLAEVVVDAVEGVRAAYPQRRIAVDLQEGLIVPGDSDQLQRVVRNLITNAAVHTRPDGPIDVGLRRDGAYALVQVRDSGPGLPPEDAVHVFERFWRADKARSRASGGSGLGMAIVAATVQAHGGTVRFDSTVEHGSTVSVWLPLGTA